MFRQIKFSKVKSFLLKEEITNTNKELKKKNVVRNKQTNQENNVMISKCGIELL